MKIRYILCYLGFGLMLLGGMFIFGACGGIETGGAMATGAKWILSGLGLIGLGAFALKLSLGG